MPLVSFLTEIGKNSGNTVSGTITDYIHSLVVIFYFKMDCLKQMIASNCVRLARPGLTAVLNTSKFRKIIF